MTERLYYTDSYVTRFHAQVIAAEGDKVYLDRTAFYPTSGGQPFDLGTLNGVPVIEVEDEGDRIAHRITGPAPAGAIEGVVDWSRRFDHMQQHSGQHLLSAVFVDLFGFQTVSFHLGAETCTIDLETPAIGRDQLIAAERRSNELIYENRPMTVAFQDASQATDLRKASEREGTLRIVSIENYDRSACGGTHVRATGEIGSVLLRKTEKIRNTTRVEFLCGMRAVQRARADYESLTTIAQTFSAPLDEAAALVASQMENARTVDRAYRKLAADLSVYQGRELYEQTQASPDGIKRHLRRQPVGSLEEIRGLAQSFTAQGKAIFIGVVEDTRSVLLAASPDAGVDAGKLLKAELTTVGGRGGGAPKMAQGSVPTPQALETLAAKLSQL